MNQLRHFILFFFTCVMLFSACQSTQFARESVQNTKPESVQTQALNYMVFLPDGYDKSKQDWPLILFLHGAGERGNDIEKVAFHGLPKLARQGQLNNCILIAPQCPEGDYWDSLQQQNNLVALLAEARKKYNIDDSRMYLTGLSMGGFGTWQLGATLHDEFAAIVPICGGGNVWNARLLTEMPVWAFHGGKDPVVPVEFSENMVDQINKLGGNAKLTIYPEAGHNSWDEAYNDEQLWQWLFEQKKEID